MSNAKLIETVARHRALESLTIESGPAFFETTKGERTDGFASVQVTRASIAIRFTTERPMAVGKAAYGEANGKMEAINGAWSARRVNDAGALDGDRLFGTQEVKIKQGADAKIAATRLVFAGDSWEGSGTLEGRRVIVAPLTGVTVSHHDDRFSITAEGDLDATTIEAMDRAAAFVTGVDLELLRVESFSAQGDLVRVRHLREYRRLGRGPHSPFSGVGDEHRMRAWIALAAAIPRLEKEGVPIITMINHHASHNTVAEINSSAVLLLLLVQTAAYHRMHGLDLGAGAASRRKEMEVLSRELDLRLTEADLDRFERLRVELLDGGFFHKPGYETGRPQKDIKFIRDVAHMTVFRMCGYTGPFYGAETFATREVPAYAAQ